MSINFPNIAQLVERLTVEVTAAIRRSPVRIRLFGIFFSWSDFTINFTFYKYLKIKRIKVKQLWINLEEKRPMMNFQILIW